MRPTPDGLPGLGTRSRQVYAMVVNEGWTLENAARFVGIKPQTAERIHEKYILPHELMLKIGELEKRVADLEAELNMLKGVVRG